MQGQTGLTARIYALLYGNDFKLHDRLLQSLVRFVPQDKANIVLWCNTVGTRTKDAIRRYVRTGVPIQFFFSDENVPKHKVMRKLFHEDAPPDTPWIIWLDDDSYISLPDWWDKTLEFIESKKSENICYLGQQWYVHHLRGQWDFISKATWFKGRQPEMCPTRKRTVKKPGITFAQGAYWWLRTDVMKQIDWPDPRLSHNGGDTLLGEAVRQQGLPFHKFHYGMAVNKAKRRGLSERPAGSAEDVRR